MPRPGTYPGDTRKISYADRYARELRRLKHVYRDRLTDKVWIVDGAWFDRCITDGSAWVMCILDGATFLPLRFAFFDCHISEPDWLRSQIPPKKCTLVFDMAFRDYRLWQELERTYKSYFITELKSDVIYTLNKHRSMVDVWHGLADQGITIRTSKQRLRMVTTLRCPTPLLTNSSSLSVHEIVTLYQRREQIEHFFGYLRRYLYCELDGTTVSRVDFEGLVHKSATHYLLAVEAAMLRCADVRALGQ